MIVTLGQTTNFIIKYDDTLSDGLRRAKAVKSKCESDFAQLRGWFTATGGFGSSNLVTVTVGSGSGGNNNGYQIGGGTSVNVSALEGSANKTLADDGTRAIFVAEIVEVLMSYQNYATGTTTWHAGWSDGEGLSRVSMEFLYPNVDYQILGAPYVNGWMQSSRPDYVSTNETTDTDGISFGCSMLFIYYLYSQLGYDIVSIVSKAGSTLEATYNALTGKSGGYAAMTGLLAKYFPLSETPYLPFDDPFPLLDGIARSVYVTMGESSAGSATVAALGKATFNACGSGPKSKYDWTLYDQLEQLTCSAQVTGFGQPVYNWKVNGIALPGGSGEVTVTATVEGDDPNAPESPTSSTQSVTLFYGTAGSESYQGLSGELVLFNSTFPGHVLLTVEADVNELYASSDVTSGLALGTLDTQALQYEAKYYCDLQACRIAALREFGPILEIAPWVTLLLTLPDPPLQVMNGAAVLSALANEVAAISATRPQIGEQVANTMARVLNVPVGMLLPGSTKAGN